MLQMSRWLGTVCVIILASGYTLAQTKSKKEDVAKDLSTQKKVMAEMRTCFHQMDTLNEQLKKEKRSTEKLRKDLREEAERMIMLSEAWKPFCKTEKAQKLAAELISASQEIVKATKPLGKKAAIHDGVLAVRMACAECHKGYKPKEEAGSTK